MFHLNVIQTLDFFLNLYLFLFLSDIQKLSNMYSNYLWEYGHVSWVSFTSFEYKSKQRDTFHPCHEIEKQIIWRMNF